MALLQQALEYCEEKQYNKQKETVLHAMRYMEYHIEGVNLPVISISLDEIIESSQIFAMKKELDEMCAEMGMNITTFFMIYAKKALRDRKIPFEITAPVEPFYSEKNLAQIQKADQQVKIDHFAAPAFLPSRKLTKPTAAATSIRR